MIEISREKEKHCTSPFLDIVDCLLWIYSLLVFHFVIKFVCLYYFITLFKELVLAVVVI